MRLILNEQELLDRSLNEGYVDCNKPNNTIRLLVKHYLSVGMNRQQVYDSVDKFLQTNYNEYNSVNWMQSIQRQIRKIQKIGDYKLINIKEVLITKSELETIKSIHGIRLQKLAFVLLVYAKIYNQINNTDKNWVNEEHKYIFSDAKVAVTKEEQCKMIHKLKELGLVDVSVMVDNTNIKVNFIDNDSSVAITIRDFRNYVYEYLLYIGQKIGRCNCGNLYKITGKNHKMCKICWDKKAKEIKREWWNNTH